MDEAQWHHEKSEKTMKDIVVLYYDDAMELAHAVKVAVLREMGYEYKDLPDGKASGVDYVAQNEVDNLFE